MSTDKFSLFHILEAQQFDRSWLEKKFFPKVEQLSKLNKRNLGKILEGKSVALIFYEPSTRTRFSFQQAATSLGATVAMTESAKDYSSAAKGETLKDSIRTYNALRFDAIVLRSPYEGGAKEAASISKIPIINAGDGPGQHPTQSLLDLYTIYQHFGRVDGLKIALVGDLRNGRTTRSLAYLLGKFKNMTIDFIAPSGFQIDKDMLDYLDKHKVSYKLGCKLINVASKVDVVYLTRLQKERLGKKSKVNGQGVKITKQILEKLPQKSIIMHPLPRSGDFSELAEQYTEDPRVVIFKQVENGVKVRTALLAMIDLQTNKR